MPAPSPFVPPPYPYARLDALKRRATEAPGGIVDLSIGTPCDPVPDVVTQTLAGAGPRWAGYPVSVGLLPLREAACGWMERRLGVSLPPSQVIACVGTKELVASLPHLLRLRDPSRDTVLYPAISYPTYEMGAILAGCRAVPVDDIASIDPADAARALMLWVNSPGNPTGELRDLEAAASWGRERNVPVLSDECYLEYTWTE